MLTVIDECQYTAKRMSPYSVSFELVHLAVKISLGTVFQFFSCAFYVLYHIFLFLSEEKQTQEQLDIKTKEKEEYQRKTRKKVDKRKKKDLKRVGENDFSDLLTVLKL